MCVFVDFWKLETENSLLHVFSFLHKLSFENSFCFLPVLSCQTSFLVTKIENCFWKQKTRGKNSYQTYPKLFHLLHRDHTTLYIGDSKYHGVNSSLIWEVVLRSLVRFRLLLVRHGIKEERFTMRVGPQLIEILVIDWLPHVLIIILAVSICH